jgi:hypothetical protein
VYVQKGVWSLLFDGVRSRGGFYPVIVVQQRTQKVVYPVIAVQWCTFRRLFGRHTDFCGTFRFRVLLCQDVNNHVASTSLDLVVLDAFVTVRITFLPVQVVLS